MMIAAISSVDPGRARAIIAEAERRAIYRQLPTEIGAGGMTSIGEKQ
jgi:hypothetical protein